MPAKSKAKLGIKAKREAVIKRFGDSDPFELSDASYINWCYSRRHLATVRTGSGEIMPKYLVEKDGLDEAIRKTLDLIRERDGMKIFKEVADDLLNGIVFDVRHKAGRKGLRRALDQVEESVAPLLESGSRIMVVRSGAVSKPVAGPGLTADWEHVLQAKKPAR